MKGVKKVIANARSLIGAPYKRGAYVQKKSTKESAFDCSSLIQYIFRKAGVELPRSSILQAAAGEEIKGKKNLMPGDLIFFEGGRGHYWHSLFNDKKVYIGHVAVYIGRGKIIDAEEARGGVSELKLSEISKRKFYKITLIKRVAGFVRPIFKVPAYSQFLDVRGPGWQDKSCGIVSLKMIIDFLGNRKNNPDADSLIEKGLKINCYIKNIGWSHNGLVMLAKKYGFKAQSFDWAGNSAADAFSLLKTGLKTPVIASIYKNLKPGSSGHLVVVKGFANGNAYYNDPDSKDRKSIARKAPLKKFITGWKKRIIVIYP